MTDETSVRPARLLRFEGTMEATADGLRRRTDMLADAIAQYEATCNAEFRAPTSGLTTTVRDLAGDFDDWGAWTGSIARAAISADDYFCSPWGLNPDDDEDVFRVSTGWLAGQLGSDPYRGVADGTASVMARGLDIDYDQSGPPAWIDHLSGGGDLAGIASELLKAQIRVVEGMSVNAVIRITTTDTSVRVLRGNVLVTTYTVTQMEARLRVPVQAPARWTTVARGLGRLSGALGFGAGFLTQWDHDQNRPTGERLARSAGRGAAGLGGGILGGMGAGAIGSAVCGPGAPLCVAPFVIGGGILGGLGADKLFDSWFNDDPKPGEYDLDSLEDIIAADGDEAEVIDEINAGVEELVQELLEENPPPPSPLDFIGPRLLPGCTTPPPVDLVTLLDDLRSGPTTPVEPVDPWERFTFDGPALGPTRERAEALFGPP